MKNVPKALRPFWPLIFGFAVLLVAVIGTAIISIQQQRSSAAVRSALEIESQLNRAQTLITDAETGQRGFLLTGRENYLEPYLLAKRDLIAEIDNLSALIRGESGPQTALQPCVSWQPTNFQN
jgi:CHASE3 domain sensor protein